MLNLLHATLINPEATFNSLYRERRRLKDILEMDILCPHCKVNIEKQIEEVKRKLNNIIEMTSGVIL